MVRASWLAMATACTFTPAALESSDAVPPDDAPALDVATVDGAPDAVARDCMPRWLAGTVALSPPVALAELNTAGDERDPFLARDHLTIYFLSDRPGGSGHDVWMATRPGPAAAFGSIAPVPGVNSDGFDSKLSTTADGLFGILASDRGAAMYAADLYTTSRPSLADDFETPTSALTANLNTGSAAWDPALSADGLRVVFESGGLEVASRTSRASAFGPPTLLANVNTGTESDPALSADERVLLFSSGRPGGIAGSRDLWVATRGTLSQPFANPAWVPMVNTAGTEGDPFLTADGCRLYYASNDDLFFADVQ